MVYIILRNRPTKENLQYSFIKYKKNNIKYDMAYLTNSFNIVSAKSSFLVSIIKLNDNLQYLWEYDFYKLSER